jgi:hypothetical protein
MSKSNPLGFFVGVIVEVVAVVFIVSLLPKVDLRATTEHEGPSFVQPQETSYYQRHAAAATSTLSTGPAAEFRSPPPLIAVDPDRPGFVQERLDRASQGLVNGVGSYVSDAASELARLPRLDERRAAPPLPTPQAAAAPPEVNLPLPANAAAAPAAGRPRAPAGTAQYQPRPWMRY